MEVFLGSILPMAFPFAPRGWASCEGQLMSIAQNTALFSLLGTRYGGNGQSTFGLPDLRGRMIIGQGQGPGLPAYQVGQSGGATQTTLNILQLPAHTHPVVAKANSFSASTGDPANAFFGGGSLPIYDTAWDNSSTMNPACMTASPTGGSQPFSIQNPYVAMYYNIATQGIFPSRN
ncbi:MAG: phage tail protein [Flavipsychrobacter sp.]|nr:phage tail protein [Flavipsychrobacter sp.]